MADDLNGGIYKDRMIMKFIVMGVPEGEDFPSFEKEIPIEFTDLALIMGGRMKKTHCMITC